MENKIKPVHPIVDYFIIAISIIATIAIAVPFFGIAAIFFWWLFLTLIKNI